MNINKYFVAAITSIILLVVPILMLAKNTSNINSRGHSSKSCNEQRCVIGAMAPTFKLKAADNKIISLSDYLGSNVVLYFYPKDNTPFCTIEASNFDSLSTEFKMLNTVIIGVSRDTIVSHQKFIKKHGYTFPLLSDENGDVSRLYGVLKPTNKNGWSKRTTFLINSKGTVVKVWKHVNVSRHASEVLEEVKTLVGKDAEN